MITPVDARAQARPVGGGRLWTEIGVEAAAQPQRCGSCLRQGTAIGPAISWAIGTTFPAGFGIALAGRTVQEFSWEYSQNSGFLLLVGQYSLPSVPKLTMNFGAGKAHYHGDRSVAGSNYGDGSVLSAGAALRWPASKRVAFTVNTSILKSAGGSTDFRPITVTFGVGLSLSTPCRNQRC